MDLTIDNALNLMTVICTILYGVSHLLAIFGKPKWAAKVSSISKAIDIGAANHTKSINYLD